MVLHKPHLFGTIYQKINYGGPGYIFDADNCKGKDAPKEPSIVYINTNNHGQTSILCLCLCKPLYFTGKALVLDSVFCVLQCLIEIKKLDVFDISSMKAWCSFPKYVNSKEMEDQMKDMEVGDTGVWQGILDSTKYFIFV